MADNLKPCPKCGAKLRKKITVRKEIVYDHPRNGCEEESLRVRSYAVNDWNRMAEDGKAVQRPCCGGLRNNGLCKKD